MSRAAANRDYKTDGTEVAEQAKESKTDGRDLCQEIGRQVTNRERNYDTRSHKSNQWLTDSQRDDSREQLYSRLDVWAGMDHE